MGPDMAQCIFEFVVYITQAAHTKALDLRALSLPLARCIYLRFLDHGHLLVLGHGAIELVQRFQARCLPP